MVTQILEDKCHMLFLMYGFQYIVWSNDKSQEGEKDNKGKRKVYLGSEKQRIKWDG